MGVGVEEVHSERTQSGGNFDDDEAEEDEEDLSTGEDLGGGAEEDVGDSRDFNENRSSRDSRDDSIVEGPMAHGGGDRATSSLEGCCKYKDQSKSKMSIYLEDNSCECSLTFTYAWDTRHGWKNIESWYMQ